MSTPKGLLRRIEALEQEVAELRDSASHPAVTIISSGPDGPTVLQLFRAGGSRELTGEAARQWLEENPK